VICLVGFNSADVGRIIRHLGLSLLAEELPLVGAFDQVARMAAEESGEYE
jgi:hypothetical protein